MTCTAVFFPIATVVEYVGENPVGSRIEGPGAFTPSGLVLFD